MCGAQLGELLVVRPDDGGGGVAVLAIPEWIDGQHFHVDSHRVHLREPLGHDDELILCAPDRRDYVVAVIAHQGDRLVEHAMGMNVDGLDALAADRYREARGAGRAAPCCARAASSSAQLQNARPDAAPARLRKSLRVVISPPWI